MEQSTNQRSGKRTSIFLYLFLISLLANIGLVYLIFHNQNAATAKMNQLLDDQKTQYEKDLQNLNDKLRAQITLTKGLEGDNQALTDSLEVALMEIEEVQSNLENALSITRNELVFYKQKIDAYEILLRKKDERIQRLEKDNENLVAKNIEQQKTTMAIKENLAEEKQKVKNIQNQMEEAAVFQAENVDISIIDNKGRKTSGGQYRAKKIDKLDITFNLAGNKLTEIGSKNIYLRVLEPAGTVLANPGSSGSFQVEGKNYTYSAYQQIIFDKSRQKVRFQFSRTGSFQAGRHKVEFYTDGRKIGTGSFNVR